MQNLDGYVRELNTGPLLSHLKFDETMIPQDSGWINENKGFDMKDGEDAS